jgi:hypothetical protein
VPARAGLYVVGQREPAQLLDGIAHPVIAGDDVREAGDHGSRRDDLGVDRRRQ